MDMYNTLEEKITENHYVLVTKLGSDQLRSIKIVKGQTMLIDKLKIKMDCLIGKPFGKFEVSGFSATPIPWHKILEESQVEIEASFETCDAPTIAPSGDNTLHEAQARQSVTEEAIGEMKKQGTSASELISKLVEGNATFHNRTEYAKSKYIQKKVKKHSDRIIILRPSVRLLCETYYKKEPERTGGLRWDLLGLMLQLAGIHSGKRVVAFEQACGVVAAAILERLAGRGVLVLVHRGLQAQGIQCVHSMSFSEQVLATLHQLRIDTLLNGGIPKENRETPSDPTQPAQRSPPPQPIEETTSLARREERINAQRAAYAQLEAGFDALIISTRTVDPISVLQELYDKLRPCGTIVIYGPILAPLIGAYNWLRDKGAVNAQIQDQMFRVHQVLPQRTHPLMSQNVSGGAIVSAIKVILPPPRPQVDVGES